MPQINKIDDEFCPVYLELPAEKIVELKFLLDFRSLLLENHPISINKSALEAKIPAR